MMENKTATKQSNKSTKKKSTFADYRAEFKKIIWPTGPELRKQTITVIITCIIISAIIFGLDSAFSAGQNGIIKQITSEEYALPENSLEDAIQLVPEGAEEAAENAGEAVEGTVNKAEEAAEGTVEEAADTVEEAVEEAQE
jgi:preprotein translocase subunit SecE